MSQLHYNDEVKLQNFVPTRTLASLSKSELCKPRIIWTGATALAPSNPVSSTSTPAILFHSLRAENRAQVYATDLLFDPSATSFELRRHSSDQLNHSSSSDEEEEEEKEEEFKHDMPTGIQRPQYTARYSDLEEDSSSSSDSEQNFAEQAAVFIPEWLSVMEEISAEIESIEIKQIARAAVKDIISDITAKVIDFLDRKIVWFAEKALGKLSENYTSFGTDSALEKSILADTARVVEILVFAEKVWFHLRGAPVPVSLLNVFQSALRFHVVIFMNETLGKLRLLLSEALAIEAEHLEIRLASSSRLREVIENDSETLEEFLKRNSYMKPPTVLQLRFSTTNEKEIFFRTDHFMHDLEVRKLKGKVIEILEEIFYTHAPNPVLQEANRTLVCLATKFSEESPLKLLSNSLLFDSNLLGVIFKFSNQKSTLDLDRLTQHILSCGISPLSTSASRDRVLNLMRFYGCHLADKNPEAYEMDLDGFIRFYSDAFLERPMLSWYDYLAYGFSHDFERDSRIVPLCMSIQSVSKSERSRYESYSIEDYLKNPKEIADNDESKDRGEEQEGDKERFWATNRVEFTSRGVLERPEVLSMLEHACRHPQLRDVSQTVSEVLQWRATCKTTQGGNYSSGKVAPIAALYL